MTQTDDRRPIAADEDAIASGADPSALDGHQTTAADKSADDDEFDRAWREANAADGNAGAEHPQETAPEHQQVAELAAPDGATAEPPQPQKQETAEQQATPAPQTPQPASQSQAPEQAPKPEDVERIKQELRSWQGRKAKAQQEAEAIEARLAELRRQEEELHKRRAAEDGDKDQNAEQLLQQLELSDEEREVLSEYPSLGKALASVASKLARRIVESKVPPLVEERVHQRVAPIEERAVEASVQAHFAAIEAVHPDYRSINPDDVEAWIRSQPYDKAIELLPIFERGTAQQVIDLLNAYKAARSGVTQSVNPATPSAPTVDPMRIRREMQRQAGAPVRRASGGPPPGAAPKDDFDAAWEEAIRELR